MLTAAEFDAAMARLGPWDAARRVAVAVSGGPDSLALAVLAQRWGDPVAFIVDHGLRAESAGEAETARAALAARGMPARVLRLERLSPGPGLPARARRARYAALSAACRAAGLVDLLLGHHAGDQAETVLMRQRRGSGLAGLAGMAALTETDDVRLVRPLLGIAPERLRGVAAAAGLTPVQDPTNDDQRFTRARLRREIGGDRAALLSLAANSAQTRSAAEAAVAAELALRALLRPEGFAVLSPGAVRPDSLAALLRSLSGRRLPISGADALAAAPRAATMAGVRLLPAGRLGPGWLLVREAAAMAPPVPSRIGAVWDARFRVTAADGSALGPAGRDRRGLPRAALCASPAFRDADGREVACGRTCPAGLPAAGAPFAP